MDRYTQLPSGRSVNDFYYELKSSYSIARSVVNSLLSGKYSIVFKEDAEGLAYMNHNSRTIVVNPIVYIAAFDPMVDTIKNKSWSVVRTVLRWGFIGLVCHEIGHAIYTLSPADQPPYLQGCKVPEYFVHFCANVVEDSYIQNKMKQRFRWDLIKDGLNTVTSLFQGLTTCEDFSKKKEFTPQDKLFYFILRSYNPNFDKPQGCDIPDALIDEFLSFYYNNDMVERFKYTVSWSEKVYDWLKDELKQEDQDQSNSQNQGQQGQQGQGQSNGQGQGQQSSQSQSGGSGVSNEQGTQRTQAEIEQAIKDMVDKLSQKTGVGNGADKDTGKFDPNVMANDTISDLVGLCNGICTVDSGRAEPLNDTARQLLSAYNLNFRRLQVYSFNGTAYNQSSGRLYQSKIYKSDISTKIFTRECGRKRDMDLYFGITLDASGSMDYEYETLTDIIVPLLHSLNSIKAKSEMLVFSNDTVKVKDYFKDNLNNLYATVKSSDFSGGTDLLPSLKYFNSILKERVHKDKCIIVVTDGQTENMQECAQAIKALRKFNTCVVGIGLKLGDDPKWFTDLFGEDSLLYPDEDSIKNNIAVDLINYLSNKFMRR